MKIAVGELELLTIIWDLDRFKFYLYLKQVQLFSDNLMFRPRLKN